MKKVMYVVFRMMCFMNVMHSVIVNACYSTNEAIRTAAYAATYDHTMMRKEV